MKNKMENRQTKSNSNESLPTTTQRNSTQRQSLQPNNSLDPFTSQDSNVSFQDIQNETSHLSPLTFDFFRPRQSLLRPNFRPQTIPIFVSNQNPDLNFLSPYSLQSLPSQNLYNLSVGSYNFWNTESFLQNITQYNPLSPYFVRSFASQATAPFIPTSRFQALPFTSISPVSLPPITSFDSSISVMKPLTTPSSSSTEVPDSDKLPLKTNAEIVTISIPVQTEPTEVCIIIKKALNFFVFKYYFNLQA